jgi:hypothetical protein
MPPKVARHFALLGPIEFAGETVNLSATGQSIRTLPYISMKANATGDYAIGQVRIESSDILGTSSLVARIGAVEAKCSIEVAEPKRNERPSIRFEFNGSDNPPRRVDTLMENAQLVVRIYGAHKSITKILGNYRGDKFERETELESLTLISEIIASELAIYAVEREWENHADRFPDASSIFVRQRERASSLLPSIQSLLM